MGTKEGEREGEGWVSVVLCSFIQQATALARLRP